jgi:hypothetical protein
MDQVSAFVRHNNTASIPRTHSSCELGQLAIASLKERSFSSKVVPTNWAELSDGTLLDLVEHPSDSEGTLLALWKDGRAIYKEKLENAGRILVPMPRCSKILTQIRLPRVPKPYGSMLDLTLRIFEFLKRYVVLKEEYLWVLTHFVLSSWVADRLPVAPYLALVGLPQSGKTTLLRALDLICRRSLLIADASIAGIYQLYAQLPPTLLIDEASSFTEAVALRRLLRTGTTRDVNTIRGEEALHAFGPKVISWIDPPDDPALNSRCFQISMIEARQRVADLSDCTTAELADELQAQLLQFRLENYNKVRGIEIPGINMLRPRSRDLLRALIAPLGDNLDICKPLISIFKQQDILQKEPLPPEHNAVVATLFSHIHQDSFKGLMHVSNLTDEVNRLLAKRRERLRLQPRKIGAILSTLGFSQRLRRNNGWIVALWEADQERIHDLVETHGMDSIGLSSMKVDLAECRMCQGEHHNAQQVRKS